MKDNPKILDDLAGYLNSATASDDSVLASEWTVTPAGHVRYDLTLGMVRALHAENRELRREILTLRHVLDTFKPIIIPLWERVAAQVVAAWKILEPILTAIDAEPRHGEGNICKICDRGIVYLEKLNRDGSVNHASWQHKIEPDDGHQAVRTTAITTLMEPSSGPLRRPSARSATEESATAKKLRARPVSRSRTGGNIRICRVSRTTRLPRAAGATATSTCA